MGASDLLADIAMRSQILQEGRRQEPIAPEASAIEPEQEEAEAQRDPTAICALADGPWADWLRALEPDRLIVLLVDAPQALRERVVESLDEDSQEWLRQNLALLGSVTAANARESWDHAWEAYDALDTGDAPTCAAPKDEQLRSSMMQLLRLGGGGQPPWQELIAAAGDPLLASALGAAGAMPVDQLAEALEALQQEHIAAEQRRSTFVLDAVRALAAGEDAERFAQRWQLEG